MAALLIFPIMLIVSLACCAHAEATNDEDGLFMAYALFFALSVLGCFASVVLFALGSIA